MRQTTLGQMGRELAGVEGVKRCATARFTPFIAKPIDASGRRDGRRFVAATANAFLDCVERRNGLQRVGRNRRGDGAPSSSASSAAPVLLLDIVLQDWLIAPINRIAPTGNDFMRPPS
jgi:hypothetical protein